MATAGKRGQVKAVGTAVAFVDEATTATGNISYQITDTTKRIWARFITIVVEDGGVPTVEAYTVNRLTGTVTFGSAVVRVITVTGSYLPVVTIGCATEYSWTLSASNEDSTCFAAEWIDRTQTLLDFGASLGKFYDINNYFWGKLTADTDLVLEFYTEYTASPNLRAWVKIASDDISNAVDGLSEESLDFEGTQDADRRVISMGPF